ncbi:O-antigen polymerase [Sporolactobacillus sp. STCC-11]|uniref:O-antigen polymerase n=1 Tax=Sporolactobacillus caesalpiniae TaxID=3230362 RepID=UPI0033955AE9
MYKKIWWIHPVSIYAILMLLVILANRMSEAQYRLQYNTSKGINSTFVILYFATFICFVFGYLISKKHRVVLSAKRGLHYGIDKFDFGALSINSVYRVYRILFWICIIAYCIWYINFLRINGLSILSSFRSTTTLANAMYVMRDNSGRVSGITTFTETGMLVLPLGVYVIANVNSNLIKKKIIKQMGLIIILALFRSISFSERLAIIELLVPMIVTMIALTNNKKFRVWIWLAPVFAIIALVVVFGLFEYTRSWLRFYHTEYDSYLEFIIQRIVGYYNNAINTECLYVSHSSAGILPYRSIEWLWNLPGMSYVYSLLAPFNIPEAFTSVLNTYANPEYNNPGGLLTFYVDFGLFFPIFQIAFGYIVGRLYKLFLKGNLVGLIMYSYVYMCLLELPRLFSLGGTRSFFVYVALIIILFKVGRQPNATEEMER